MLFNQLVSILSWAARRAAAALLLCLFAMDYAMAQTPPDSLRFFWDADMMAIFDNREGDSKMTPTKTWFLTRLSPELGASFVTSGARHRVAGGAVWVQPIGSEWEGYRISPTLYYRYEGRQGISASMGMFGRQQLIRDLPNFLVSDSAYYWQRNIRGALLQYQRGSSFFEALIDWRGMQCRHRREAFCIIAQGEWRRGSIVAGGVAMMNHLARSSEPTDDQHVVDNFVANPYLGLDWRGLSAGPWSGYLHLGSLWSMTRDRGDSSWITHGGLWLEGEASWRFLIAKNTLYAGAPLFPLHNRYGALLDGGEPYYAAKWYDRLSLGAALVSNANVLLRASLDFNLAPGNFTFYQRLALQVNIGSVPRRPRLML
ncbi:MAG: hypothetical protein NC342_01770 [Pseudoflavonifractor sp.]|nr:hypothetical protein [Alloprevotella sp.]MCM1116251.1 hypothetical protein [Pseudoflavonifractor sp.]